MRIFLPAILSLALVTFGANAQQDPKAAAIMEKMNSIISGAPSIAANFEYHYKNVRTGEDYSTVGQIWIKGKKYKISIPDLESETYFDGTTIWNYLAEANEVNIANPDPSANDFFISNPLGLFQLYQKDFKLKYLGDVEGSNSSEIDLFPLDMGKPYHRIRLTVDRAGGMLQKAVASGKNGESYELILTGVKSDKILQDSFFTFTKANYPGVTMIDLRN